MGTDGDRVECLICGTGHEGEGFQWYLGDGRCLDLCPTCATDVLVCLTPRPGVWPQLVEAIREAARLFEDAQAERTGYLKHRRDKALEMATSGQQGE